MNYKQFGRIMPSQSEQIEHLLRAIAGMYMYPQKVDRVRALEKCTQWTPSSGLDQGYMPVRALQFYSQIIECFQALDADTLSSTQRARIGGLIQTLKGN